MQQLTRDEAHLIVAGIRVLSYLNKSTPTPMELAEFLNESESAIRLRLSILTEAGVVALVESAFATHMEIRDYLEIEQFEEEEGPEITEDLKEFDKRKKEEAEKMSRLFEEGDHVKKQQERIDQMDDSFKDFKKKKPINPFDDSS